MRATSLQELAEAAMQEFLHHEERRAIQEEIKAFCKLHPELRQKFFGQYIAIYYGKFIDFDPDVVTLAERVERYCPDATPLLTPVRDEPIETFTIHSR